MLEPNRLEPKKNQNRTEEKPKLKQRNRTETELIWFGFRVCKCKTEQNRTESLRIQLKNNMVLYIIINTTHKLVFYQSYSAYVLEYYFIRLLI